MNKLHAISLDREKDDFYSTDPIAIDLLFAEENFSNNIWEPAVGQGHLSKRMEEFGKVVRKSDIIDRDIGAEIQDFLTTNEVFDGDIITNPPFKYSAEFMEKALSSINNGSKVALFMKTLYLEGINRYNRVYSINPPKRVLVFSKRISTWRDGLVLNSGSMISFSWYIWEKGWSGKTQLEWINTK